MCARGGGGKKGGGKNIREKGEEKAVLQGENKGRRGHGKEKKVGKLEGERGVRREIMRKGQGDKVIKQWSMG